MLPFVEVSFTHLLVFSPGCLCSTEVTPKFQRKCLILGVCTCFYQVGNWDKQAFQEFEEEFP